MDDPVRALGVGITRMFLLGVRGGLKKDKVMAKPTKYIAIGLATTQFEPQGGEVISLAACGEGREFLRVFTLDKDPIEGKFWSKRSELLTRIYTSSEAVEPEEGWKDFGKWLTEFKAKLVALTGGLDFWWVYQEMLKHTGKCAFGSRYTDVGSYTAGQQGRLDAFNCVEIGTPMEIARARYELVKAQIPKVPRRQKVPPITRLSEALRGGAPRRLPRWDLPATPPPRTTNTFGSLLAENPFLTFNNPLGGVTATSINSTIQAEAAQNAQAQVGGRTGPNLQSALDALRRIGR
jgi:hypothetical protein